MPVFVAVRPWREQRQSAASSVTQFDRLVDTHIFSCLAVLMNLANVISVPPRPVAAWSRRSHRLGSHSDMDELELPVAATDVDSEGKVSAPRACVSLAAWKGMGWDWECTRDARCTGQAGPRGIPLSRRPVGRVGSPTQTWSFFLTLARGGVFRE
jgi:hypothetical protein